MSRSKGISALSVAAVCVAFMVGMWGNVPASSASSAAGSSTDASDVAQQATSYKVTRYAIDTKQEYASFIAKFEAAVPPFNVGAILAGVSSWDDVIRNTAQAAPNGFLIYSRLPGSTLFQINGVGLDNRRSVGYLMGNHVVAETMYRHDPGATLNAPLRVLIFENEQGNAVFEIERPSDQFGSFGNKDIADVGRLLNTKVANLLQVLDVPVPAGLTRAG